MEEILHHYLQGCIHPRWYMISEPSAVLPTGKMRKNKQAYLAAQSSNLPQKKSPTSRWRDGLENSNHEWVDVGVFPS